MRLALWRVRHMGGEQQDLTGTDRDVDHPATLEGLQDHLPFKLVKKLLSGIVMVVRSRIRPANDHDDEFGLAEYLAVADGGLQFVAVAIDPFPEIEGGERLHGAFKYKRSERVLPAVRLASRGKASTMRVLGWQGERTMSFNSTMRLLAVFGPLLAGMAAAADNEPVQATWKDHEVQFMYFGRTAFYSCDSLEAKVERILRELGAREDLKVRVNGCMSPFTPEPFLSVRINMALPVAVTPGSGLQGEEKTRRELVARVRGETAASRELEEPFPAEWKRIRFSRTLRFLEDGDCELVEHLERHVFRKVDIRVTRENRWCVPGQVTFGQLNMEVESLVALPKPDDAGKPAGK